MPELPEVETIKLGLENKIVDLKITAITVLNPKSFQTDPKDYLGKKVINVWRRGKVLGIDFANKSANTISLLIHLKMSGQIIFIPSLAYRSTPPGGYSRIEHLGNREVLSPEKLIGGHPTKDMFSKMPNKSTRVIFEFSDGSKLYFNDQRKFGWIKRVQKRELIDKKTGFFAKVGPEPLEEEFTWQILKQGLLKHPKTPVKVALLDQSVVAGVGNIYANEGCFNAGIDPRRKIYSLADDEIKKLHQGVIKALSDGIKYGGSTRTNFVSEEGKKGLFLDHAFVYNQDKTACKRCCGNIKKIKLAGRGTFYCPQCQNSFKSYSQ